MCRASLDAPGTLHHVIVRGSNPVPKWLGSLVFPFISVQIPYAQSRKKVIVVNSVPYPSSMIGRAAFLGPDETKHQGSFIILSLSQTTVAVGASSAVRKSSCNTLAHPFCPQPYPWLDVARQPLGDVILPRIWMTCSNPSDTPGKRSTLS